MILNWKMPELYLTFYFYIKFYLEHGGGSWIDHMVGIITIRRLLNTGFSYHTLSLFSNYECFALKKKPQRTQTLEKGHCVIQASGSGHTPL